MKIGNYDIKNTTLSALFVGGTTLAGVYFFGGKNSPEMELKNSESVIVYKQMTSQEKWDSLSVNDKVYFLKTGYNDLPSPRKKEVLNHLESDIFQKSNTFVSRLDKYKDYFKSKLGFNNYSVSKEDESRNYNNLENFLFGGEKWED